MHIDYIYSYSKIKYTYMLYSSTVRFYILWVLEKVEIPRAVWAVVGHG
jgi:hypothetical protein